ncbi:Snake venom vascular endothelial growth factor like protein [Argiope bruennichi]|uniref:Snake venom vascular endothelial growth factor like protein n=1 Tax=Argiope bruennichi TaxID=94029 RepID=A0A8T0FYT5_ARGBR|nr:Snake venom vascular endothelial growth factor like protein [Argiope bruennichi]
MRRFLCIVILCAVLLLDPISGRHSRYHKHRNHRDETPQVSADEKLALEHSERVAEAGTCDQPKMQVIHVSDHYPGRYFLPHCTMLHRCGKHAGCCGTDRLRCVAKEKQKVVLHFYSVKILDDGQLPEKKIEKLTFTNHTKCGCVPVEHFSKHDL